MPPVSLSEFSTNVPDAISLTTLSASCLAFSLRVAEVSIAFVMLSVTRVMSSVAVFFNKLIRANLESLSPDWASTKASIIAWFCVRNLSNTGLTIPVTKVIASVFKASAASFACLSTELAIWAWSLTFLSIVLNTQMSLTTKEFAANN